jgi:hypothetical protein
VFRDDCLLRRSGLNGLIAQFRGERGNARSSGGDAAMSSRMAKLKFVVNERQDFLRSKNSRRG